MLDGLEEQQRSQCVCGERTKRRKVRRRRKGRGGPWGNDGVRLCSLVPLEGSPEEFGTAGMDNSLRSFAVGEGEQRKWMTTEGRYGFKREKF